MEKKIIAKSGSMIMVPIIRAKKEGKWKFIDGEHLNIYSSVTNFASYIIFKKLMMQDFNEINCGDGYLIRINENKETSILTKKSMKKLMNEIDTTNINLLNSSISVLDIEDMNNLLNNESYKVNALLPLEDYFKLMKDENHVIDRRHILYNYANSVNIIAPTLIDKIDEKQIRDTCDPTRTYAMYDLINNPAVQSQLDITTYQMDNISKNISSVYKDNMKMLVIYF